MTNLDEFETCTVSEALSRSTGCPADNCVALYLRDVSPARLLTRREEIELAGRVKKGDREARDQMIKSNLRLVVKIARSYVGIGLPKPFQRLTSDDSIAILDAAIQWLSPPAMGGPRNYGTSVRESRRTGEPRLQPPRSISPPAQGASKMPQPR